MKTKVTFLVLATLFLSGCGATHKIEEAKKAAQEVENTSRQVQEEAQKLTRGIGEKAEKRIEDEKKDLPKQTREASSGDSSDLKPPKFPSQEEIKKYNQKYDKAIIRTNLGDIKVEFYNKKAPKTVANFLKLSEEGFYEGVKFHRVIEDFMIQSGDPNSKDDNKSDDGRGGPGYKFEDEINDKKLVKGSLAMANSGPNTNGSQFFIVTAEETPWLDGKHTNFGKVINGMEVVEKIEETKTDSRDYPTKEIFIESVDLIPATQ
jgi:cyclophilin family peptidyl-prolyl cis-trans isomerase/outer membrane murein-binding lipoprotein Lpp